MSGQQDYQPGSIGAFLLKKNNKQIDSKLADLFQRAAKPDEVIKEIVQPEQDQKLIEEAEQQDAIDQQDSSEKSGTKVDDKPVKPMKPGKDDPEVQKRTIFIGNLNVKAIEKEGKKTLKEEFSKFGEIESLRFRSLALEEPMNRKAGFINKKLHPKRTSCNAYLVFKNKESAEKALELNGKLLIEKHIRVDLVSGEKKEYNPKKSVFVGNLGFETEDDPLWELFGKCGTVTGVRVIRDPKTNLGKGFAYIQFEDSGSVAFAMKLNGSKIGGRDIRVSGCKKQTDSKPAAFKPATKPSGKAKYTPKAGGKSDKGESKKRKASGNVVIEGERAVPDDGKKKKKKPRTVPRQGGKPSTSSKARAQAWKGKNGPGKPTKK